MEAVAHCILDSTSQRKCVPPTYNVSLPASWSASPLVRHPTEEIPLWLQLLLLEHGFIVQSGMLPFTGMAEAPPNTGLMDMECLSSLSCNATKDFQRHEKQGRTNAERRCRNILTVATVLVVSFIVVQAVLGIAGHRAALSSPRVEWPVSFPDYQNGFSKELYRFVQREYIKDKGYGAPADSVKCVCSPRTHCPGEGDERRKGCCMSRVSEPSGRETSRCDMMVLGLAQVAKSCRNINMTCDEMGIVYFNMNGTRCYELAEQHKKHYCAALEEEFHLDMVTTHPKVFQSPEDLNISLLHKLQGMLFPKSC